MRYQVGHFQKVLVKLGLSGLKNRLLIKLLFYLRKIQMKIYCGIMLLVFGMGLIYLFMLMVLMLEHLIQDFLLHLEILLIMLLLEQVHQVLVQLTAQSTM